MRRCRVWDYYPLPPSREITKDGFLRAPARIARTGIQVYTARELGLDGGDKLVRLYRSAEEVSKSAPTFESVPMTDDHPPEAVNAGNWKEYSVGDVRDVSMEGEFITACVIVRDDDAVSVVRGGKAELSCGYDFDLDMTPGTTADGMSYDGLQKNIGGNHVAIVDRGRAGSHVRIGDRKKGNDTMKIQRLTIGDTKLTDKLTIPGLTFDLDLESADARSVQDKFDLHAHGIGAIKDAYGALKTKCDAAEAQVEAMGERLKEMGEKDDDEDLEQEDDEAFEGMETEQEEAEEEEQKKKAGDGAPKLTLRQRLRRAVDEVVRLRKASSPEAIEKAAEERSKVLDAALVVLGEEFNAKGKGVHAIRIAAIDAAAKDEDLAEIVKVQVGDTKIEKLSVPVARRAFDTIVKVVGKKRKAADDDSTQDRDFSRAIVDSAIGGGSTDGRVPFDPVRTYYARDAARSRRPAGDRSFDGGDTDGAEVEDR